MLWATKKLPDGAPLIPAHFDSVCQNEDLGDFTFCDVKTFFIMLTISAASWLTSTEPKIKASKSC